jgi:hypothetical protein
MVKRNAKAPSDSSVLRYPLDLLNRQIAQAKVGYETGGSSQGRRAFFKNLLSLEGQREKFYGIPAPKRRFNSR